MTDRGWVSTDLRSRHKSSFSPADTPRSNDPRGFTEDYGNDRASKGLFDSPWLCLLRFRTWRVHPLLVATIGVAASVATIQFTDSTIVILASSLNIFMILVLLLQHRRLRKHGTLRQQNNELRRQSNYLRQERERLHRTMDRLDETIADLHHIPHELHRISKNQNVDRLLAIVVEQKKLHEKIRVKINQQIMQQILTIVVREDRDQSWTLRPTEVEKIIVRLGLVEGIEFNEALFRETLSNDPSVSTIMKIIRSLLERDDEYQHGTPIFKFK